MKKYLLRITMLSMAAILALTAFAACSKQEEAPEEESTEIANPWQETDSAEAAAEGAGIEALVINDGIEISLGEVKVEKYRYMDGMIEAVVPFPAVEMTIRKGRADTAEKEGDISGDYNEYKNKWTQGIDMIDVNCEGNRDDEATKTTWQAGDYLYSVTAYGLGGDTDYGLSIGDLSLVVAGIDGGTSGGDDGLEGNRYGYAGGDPMELAVYKYLADEIGAKYYDKADCCIPVVTVVDTDMSDPEDIQVKGYYWIDNYNIEGDTLKCVSGGDHSGSLHIKLADDGSYEVLGFDPIEDGGEYIPSAEKIFGDKYEEFMQTVNDTEAREAKRYEAVTVYVNANEVPCTQYQDEGQEPVGLHL